MDQSERLSPASERLGSDIQEILAQALRQSVRKLSALIKKVVETDDPNVVHDTRVACRRLQQRLAVFFPKPRTGKVRKLWRNLRRIRRLLGEWRNCDVLLDLVAQEGDGSETPEKDAWTVIHDYLVEKRSQQIRRCRRKMAKYERLDFSGKLDKILASRVNEDDTELLARTRAAEAAAKQQWLLALTQAEISCAPEDIHQFRIATKRLRYRTEVIQKVGGKGQSSRLHSLKNLQDLLGRWHDRQSLQQVIAEALANPKLLLQTPTIGRILLEKLEERQLAQRQTAQDIVRLARGEESLHKGDVEIKRAEADVS